MSFIIFGFMAYYLLVCAVILTIKALSVSTLTGLPGSLTRASLLISPFLQAVTFTNANSIGANVLVLVTGTNGYVWSPRSSTRQLTISDDLTLSVLLAA
jgi:hypothetical protein